MNSSKFSKHLPISRRVFSKLSTAGLLTMACPLNRVYAQAGTKGPRRFFCLQQPGGMWEKRWSTGNPDGSINFGASHTELEPFADQIVALTGLDNVAARNTRAHYLGYVTMLTGSQAKPPNVNAISTARSLDQFIADKVSDNVPYSSIETGFRTRTDVGAQTRLVYSAPKTPKHPIKSGDALFEKLFKGKTPGSTMGGGNNNAGANKELIAREVRVLDNILEQVKLMQKEMVGDDKIRLQKHLDSIREIEKRVELSASGGSEACTVPATQGRLNDGPEHAELLLDLTAQAFVCGLTNVATFATRKAGVDMVYDWMPEHTQAYGNKTHHSVTHSESFGTTQADAFFTRVDQFHSGLVARMAKTLAETPEEDGSGSMLDNSLMLYTTCISKPNAHSHKNMKWMVIGGKNTGLWSGNRFVNVNGEKLHNIHVSFMRAFGHDVNSFGNSDVSGGAASGPCSALKV